MSDGINEIISMNESIWLIGDYVEIHPGSSIEKLISFNSNLSGSVGGDLEGFRYRINCTLRISNEIGPMKHIFSPIGYPYPDPY